MSATDRGNADAALAGDLPDPAALLRLAGAVLVGADDGWQVSDRR